MGRHGQGHAENPRRLPRCRQGKPARVNPATPLPLEATDVHRVRAAEGWLELMNRVLRILESEINRFGGEVSQFRGDGLVAFESDFNDHSFLQ